MNCDHLTSLIGMRCEPQPTHDGSACAAIFTPFCFHDGDALPLFARTVGPTVHLFDEGETLSWLRGLGLQGLEDRRAWRPVRQALQDHHVTLNDDGEIEVITSTPNAAEGFARMVAGMLAVDRWARRAAERPPASMLEHEAALHLQAWRPNAPLVHHPDPVQGLSGAEHHFAMAQAGELIDVINPSSSAVGNVTRKLVDLRGSFSTHQMPILIIVDDRRSPESARRESSIISRMATTWPMTALIRAATPSRTAH